MQPKFHNVNTNPKLRLQCNVGTKCSPVKYGKTLTLRKKYTLEIANKMQPCIRIYYSTVRWRL